MRYTWEEAHEHERDRLKREPTIEEVQSFYDYMNSR